MELSQQAVNALIQRTTESSSESESHLPLNPNSLYANSLLQQFVAQTQLLNAPASLQTNTADAPAFQSTTTSSTENPNNKTHDTGEVVKRKRGRPKKVSNEAKVEAGKSSVLNLEYCGNPNVSPDSGIQNSSDHVSSPEPSPTPNSKPKFKEEPEAHKNNGGVVGKPKSTAAPKTLNSKTVMREQPKQPITSNSFDRVLYGNADRVLYPPRRKVGRPPISRKGPGRPPKQKAEKAIVPPEPKPPDKLEPAKVSTRPKVVPVPTKKTKTGLLQEICQRVSKRLDSNKQHSQKPVVVNSNPNKNKRPVNNKTVVPKSGNVSKKTVLTAKNKIERAKIATLKSSKVMHSKHKDKKHKKYKMRILKPVSAAVIDPKLNTEIERLITDFVKLCNINVIKPAKENVPEMLKIMKKASKKRKASDYSDRKKKKQSISNSVNKEAKSNEQRLPLKKRHYHLSTNDSDETTIKAPTKPEPEKPEVEPKSNVPPKVTSVNNNEYKKPEKVKEHIAEAIEATITRFSSTEKTEVGRSIKAEPAPPASEKLSIPATTPKKRHRLEMSTTKEETVYPPIQPVAAVKDEVVEESTKTVETVKVPKTVEAAAKKGVAPRVAVEPKEKKVDNAVQIITRKKNRLEDLTLTLASKVRTFLYWLT